MVETRASRKLMRLKEVEAMVGWCRSQIYAQIKNGTFPAQVKLGVRSVAWRSEDIAAWIASRPVAYGNHEGAE